MDLCLGVISMVFESVSLLSWSLIFTVVIVFAMGKPFNNTKISRNFAKKSD
jgi:hypothetical protein